MAPRSQKIIAALEAEVADLKAMAPHSQNMIAELEAEVADPNVTLRDQTQKAMAPQSASPSQKIIAALEAEMRTSRRSCVLPRPRLKMRYRHTHRK
jgi:hypothetical protein